MKILLVVNEFYAKTNGLSISTQRFCDEFIRLGAEVRVLSGKSYGKTYYSLEKKEIHPFEGLIEKQGYVFAKVNKKTIKEACEWADVVHLEEPFFIQNACAKIARKMGKLITGTYHLFPENIVSSIHLGHCRLLNYFLNLWFRSMSYKYCRFIQCPTQTVMDRLKNNNYKADMEVITNGITPDRILARTNKPLEYEDKMVILSVGRFSVEKNQKTLLKALALCHHKNDIVLIMAGQGPLRKKYEKLGKKLPNKPIMKFMTREELMNVTSYADVIVHCADVEVEGMSLMEGFAGGAVPIIASSRLSATSQYAISKYNKFKARDYHELAKRIDYWFDSPEKLKEASENYQSWAKELTVEKSAIRMLEIWNNYLNNKE